MTTKPKKSIQERFETYHALNPHVFAEFCRFARELKAAGVPRGSASLIVERMRWEHVIRTRGDDKFRISNDYRSRLARLAMSTCDDLAGYFRTRPLRDEAAEALYPPKGRPLVEVLY